MTFFVCMQFLTSLRIVCLSQCCFLQTIVSRETDPVESNVVSIGSIEGGDAFNVIPTSVQINGTMRCRIDFLFLFSSNLSFVQQIALNLCSKLS